MSFGLTSLLSGRTGRAADAAGSLPQTHGPDTPPWREPAPDTPQPAGDATAPPSPANLRTFSCRCGGLVSFDNSACRACHLPLGYAPEWGQVVPLQAAGAGLWRVPGSPATAPRFRRCAMLDTAAACNWLVAEHDVHAGKLALCRCCRLTRKLPDLSVADHPLWWNRIEQAKRQLVSALIGLKLPVRSKNEDPARGMAFDMLRGAPGGPGVVTGHVDGTITLDVEEADDAWRAQRRMLVGEPSRTLLSQLRHESGHYYWQRLVNGSAWLQPCRGVFGDERQHAAQALQSHHRQAASVDWRRHCVSAYAASHPRADWAETWAYYLQLRETVDTARRMGLNGDQVDSGCARISAASLTTMAQGQAAVDPVADDFLQHLNNWLALSAALNLLSRTIGVADFCPVVLSRPAIGKLYLVHQVVAAAGTAGRGR